jgi:hypothetical protein
VLAAYRAVPQVPLTDEERNAAVRRALLVFAAGGPLQRDPTLDDPAVIELARDLDTPERREALVAALDPEAATPELAWRAFACALLADELAGE